MCRRAVAFIVTVCLIVPAYPIQAASTSAYVLGVNGVDVGRVAAISPLGNLALPLAEIATRVHRPVWRHGNAMYIQLDGEKLRIAADDNVVRCGNEDVYHLKNVPVFQGRDLFVNIEDLQRLLDVRVKIQGRRVLVNDLAGATTVFEAPAPRALRQTAAPVTAAPPVYSGLIRSRADRRSHVVVQMSLLSGGIQGRDISVEGGGDTVHAAVDVSSYDNGPAWAYGSLIAGSDSRRVQIGQLDDPLGGVVFDRKSATGATYVDRTRGLDAFDTLRNGTRRYTGVTFSQLHSDLRLALMRENGKIGALLAGFGETESSALGEFSREVWISSSGAAAGVHAQSAGRLFMESLQSYTIGNFPLEIGDSPVRENLGYRVSNALTVRAGLSSGYGTHATSYFNATLATRYTNLLLTKSAAQNAFAFSMHDEKGYVTIASAAGYGQRDWRGEGALAAGRGQLQFLAWSSNSGSSDASIEWRSTRTNSAFVFGYESLRQSSTVHTSPIAGVSLALNPDLAVQFETHPLTDGRHVRVSVAQRIDIPQPHRDVRTIVHLAGSTSAPVRLFVDDAAAQTLDGNATASIQLSSGMHTLYAQSLDGTFASVSTDVSAGTPDVTLQLLPVRTIKGRVVIADPQDFTTAPSIEGIEVDLNPAGAPALTNAAGYFTLPAQPVPSGATVSALEESLPAGVTADRDPAVDADGFMTIVLRASRRIEKTIF